MHIGGGDRLWNRFFLQLSHLRDIDLDLGLGHTAYHHYVSLIHLNPRTKFLSNGKNTSWMDGQTLRPTSLRLIRSRPKNGHYSKVLRWKTWNWRVWQGRFPSRCGSEAHIWRPGSQQSTTDIYTSPSSHSTQSVMSSSVWKHQRQRQNLISVHTVLYLSPYLSLPLKWMTPSHRRIILGVKPTHTDNGVGHPAAPPKLFIQSLSFHLSICHGNVPRPDNKFYGLTWPHPNPRRWHKTNCWKISHCHAKTVMPRLTKFPTNWLIRVGS